MAILRDEEAQLFLKNEKLDLKKPKEAKENRFHELLQGLASARILDAQNQDRISFLKKLETIAMASPELALMAAMQEAVSRIIQKYDQEGESKELLEKLLSGGELKATAIQTEKRARFEIRKLGDERILEGEAESIFAPKAEMLAILAREEGETEKRFLLIPRELPEVTVKDERESESFPGVSFGKIEISGLKLDESLQIGLSEQRKAIVQSWSALLKQNLSAILLGVGQKALERAVERANETEVNGEKIRSSQLAQFNLADLELDLDSGEILLEESTTAEGERARLNSAQTLLFIENHLEKDFAKISEIFGIEGFHEEEIFERCHKAFRVLKKIFFGECELIKEIAEIETAKVKQR